MPLDHTMRGDTVSTVVERVARLRRCGSSCSLPECCLTNTLHSPLGRLRRGEAAANGRAPFLHTLCLACRARSEVIKVKQLYLTRKTTESGGKSAAEVAKSVDESEWQEIEEKV